MREIKKIKKRNDIQVYRGISVIAVIGYHLNTEFFSSGYLGVDAFFIISGFVISNIIYSDLSQGQFSMKEFYLRRVKRIIPSLLTFIIFTQILIFFFQDSQNIFETTKGNLYSLIFISNVYFSQTFNYFEIDTTYNFIINLWSLSVEEQFYIFFPLFALITFKYKKKFLLLLYLLLFCLSLVLNQETIFDSLPFLKTVFLSFSNFSFYSPFTRLWQFLLGIFAMFLNQKIEKNIQLNSLGSSVLYVGLTTFISFNLFRTSDKIQTILVSFVLFLLLIYEVQAEKNSFLFKFLFFTGNISYSLYLFHQPIFASIRNYEYYSQVVSFFNLNMTSGIFFSIALIYLVSYLNFLNIENRFRYIKNLKINNVKPLAYLFIFTLLFLSAGLLTDGYNFREQDKYSVSKDTELDFIPGTNFLTIGGKPCLSRASVEKSCKFNQNTKVTNNRIYFLGDSVVNSLISGFIENDQLSKYEIVDLTQGSCPILVNYCNLIENTVEYQQLKNIKNSVIIVGGLYEKFNSSDTFESDLSFTLELLGNNNKVILLSTFPSPDVNLRMYERLNKNEYYFDYVNWYSKTKNVKSSMLKTSSMYKDVYFVDGENLFCIEKQCNFSSENYYYFTDHQHFSYFGAEIISDYVVDKFFR